MKIQVDVREKKLIPLIKALNNDYGYNIEIESKQLDLGDLIVCDDDSRRDGVVKKGCPVNFVLLDAGNWADIFSTNLKREVFINGELYS